LETYRAMKKYKAIYHIWRSGEGWTEHENYFYYPRVPTLEEVMDNAPGLHMGDCIDNVLVTELPEKNEWRHIVL
jgi:hypothetical protein